jgi:hypothetical protein
MYERCMTEKILEYLSGERKRKIKTTRREKTGVGWKERKEGAECAMRRQRQLSICGMDVAKREKGRERNDRKQF